MHSTLLLFRFHGEVLGSDFENESHFFFFKYCRAGEFIRVLLLLVCVCHSKPSLPLTKLPSTNHPFKRHLLGAYRDLDLVRP